MYRNAEVSDDFAYLKLYDGHDWKWFCVNLLHTDMEYLRKNWSGVKASAPTLEKRHSMCGGRGISRRYVNTRHIEPVSVYQEYAPAIPAGMHMTEADRS